MLPYYGFFDPTFILVLIGLALSTAASAYVNRTYQKYNQVKNTKGYTGADAARFILERSGIQDVTVQRVRGDLTDNYNAHDKTLNLSDSVADSTSVAAIGVAAHECGHAVQDQVHYFPLKMRHALVPVVNFSSMASFPLILLGVILGGNLTLVYIGIFLFSFAFLFQMVTLPVEINASRRALRILEDGNFLSEEELPMAKKVLTAAAMTYVAATLATFLQLLRLVLLFGNSRNSN